MRGVTSGAGRSVARVLAPGEFAWCAVFAPELHRGNPTLVVRLAAWPAPERLRSIAAFAGEMETTFVVSNDDGIAVRWFAGPREVPLCGHGALAVSTLWASCLPDRALTAVRNLEGRLALSRDGRVPLIVLNRVPLTEVPAEDVPIGVPVVRAFDAGRDFLVIVEDEDTLRRFEPRGAGLEALPKIGCILSAPCATATAAFRFFAPRAGIVEDRASGSVIPALVACWGRPGVASYRFRQDSGFGIEIHARSWGGAVAVSGDVVTFGRGRLARELVAPRTSNVMVDA